MPFFFDLNLNRTSVFQSQSPNHVPGEGKVRLPIGFQNLSASTQNIRMDTPEKSKPILPTPPPPPDPKPGPHSPPRPSDPNSPGSGNSPNPNPDLITHSTSDGQRVYALLIGVDHYDYIKPDGRDIHLFGCVNDSREVEK